MPARLPQRIVCLTDETTEVLYLLGQEHRIAGISGYTVRPPQARREKPRVAAFTSAKIDKITALKPDLILGFSDLQADVAHALIKAGLDVHVFNHRSVQGILDMIGRVGALVGASEDAEELVDDLETRLVNIGNHMAHGRRPKIYFEEWDQPMVSGIGWVSELIAIAGGEDCFAERAGAPEAAGRIIADPGEVIERAPDIIVGSWCGKKFRPEKVARRPGWSVIPAVADHRLHEIKSANILQPGPAALTDGLDALRAMVLAWRANEPYQPHTRP